MAKNEFDVVVVGAGAAGLCCASSLAEQGFHVALVAETADVAWQLRPLDVAGNHGFIQHPVAQLMWGGGWWYQLARRLNIPLHFQVLPPLELLIRGSGDSKHLLNCVSAAGIVDLFGEIAPFPIDEEARADCERVLGDALAMDWRELAQLSETPLRCWLEDRKVGPVLENIMYLFTGYLMESTPDIARQYASAWTGLGMLRAFVCGEALMASVKPDVRTGLLLPMADEIERRGGSVFRGRKVAELLIEAGRGTGAVLQDGTEIRAKAVAVATATSRVPALLPEMPDPVRAAVEFDAQLTREDVCLFSVINRPLVTVQGFTLVPDDRGSAVFLLPMHSLAPWSTKPGRQFLISQTYWTPEDFASSGGQEGIAAQMATLNEELFPGFTAATEATAVQRHRHHWLGQLSYGPKLPRRSDEIPGLWFVGDGSAPVVGIVGIELAAGAGISGGNDIAASLAG